MRVRVQVGNSLVRLGEKEAASAAVTGNISDSRFDSTGSRQAKGAPLCDVVCGTALPRLLHILVVGSLATQPSGLPS